MWNAVWEFSLKRFRFKMGYKFEMVFKINVSDKKVFLFYNECVC